MKFIETYTGVMVNFDHISCFDNDYDEDKGYSVSSIILTNGQKIPFLEEKEQFSIPGYPDVFSMADGELALLHRLFIIQYNFSSNTVDKFQESFDICWGEFEIEYKELALILGYIE